MTIDIAELRRLLSEATPTDPPIRLVWYTGGAQLESGDHEWDLVDLLDEVERLRTAHARAVTESPPGLERAIHRAQAAEQKLAYIDAVARGERAPEVCEPDCSFMRFCGERCTCHRRPVGMLRRRAEDAEQELARVQDVIGSLAAYEFPARRCGDRRVLKIAHEELLSLVRPAADTEGVGDD